MTLWRDGIGAAHFGAGLVDCEHKFDAGAGGVSLSLPCRDFADEALWVVDAAIPRVLTIISLPSEEDELTKLVADLSGQLNNVKSVEHVAAAKQFNPVVAASLGQFSDNEIFDRLVRIREGAKADASKSPKVAEFDVFASGASGRWPEFPEGRGGAVAGRMGQSGGGTKCFSRTASMG